MAFNQTSAYKELKADLEKTLVSRGLTNSVYKDMVRRYLSFRELEHLADLDIRKNGLNIWDDKRKSWQPNPCIATKVNASRQAAAIYRALGFEDEAKKARTGGAGDDDDAL